MAVLGFAVAERVFAAGEPGSRARSFMALEDPFALAA